MNILICIVGFILGTITSSLLFKIAIGELTVGYLFFSIILSTTAFLGLLGYNAICSIMLTAIPTIAGVFCILSVKVSESKWFDKKIF